MRETCGEGDLVRAVATERDLSFHSLFFMWCESTPPDSSTWDGVWQRRNRASYGGGSLARFLVGAYGRTLAGGVSISLPSVPPTTRRPTIRLSKLDVAPLPSCPSRRS